VAVETSGGRHHSDMSSYRQKGHSDVVLPTLKIGVNVAFWSKERINDLIQNTAGE
jgi:hypothetical protein